MAQLSRAFEAVPDLTRVDAIRLCRTAFGILVRGLALGVAHTLQAALLNEGLDTTIVNQAALPELPLPAQLHMAFIREEGLLAQDMYGRRQVYPWECVSVAGAGSVRTHEMEKKVQPKTDIVGSPGGGGSLVVTRRKVTYDYVEHVATLLDLFVDRAPHRWRIEAAKFNYETLGERATRSKQQNFHRLAAEILAHLPNAAFNLGAAVMAESSDEIFEYPGKATFDEELTWLLWQAEEMPRIIE